VQLIWSFIGLIFIVFTPETYAPIIVAKNKMRDSPKDGQEHHTEKSSSISAVIAQNITKIPLLLLQDIMLLLLCLWTALLLGIVYLFFELFREYRERVLVMRRDMLADVGLVPPLSAIVFSAHGFSEYQVGLSFLGLLVGNAIALSTMPLWKARLLSQADPTTRAPPLEARLEPSFVGAFLSPAGLFIFAFTSYPHVHWITPIIGSAIFGMGCIYIFFGIFSYAGANWRPVAASTLGANATLRCIFAAAFPLFAVPMAHRLTTVGAAALLAGLNCLMVSCLLLLAATILLYTAHQSH
jgi:hypothetical protein